MPKGRLARIAAGGALLLGAGFIIRGDTGVTHSAFSASTGSDANVLAAAPDWEAPTATSTVIAKVAGGAGGAIKPGAPYYVYAGVTDGGNPPSGVSTITSDVSAVTAGEPAAVLTSGSYSVAGATYNYRSGPLTADALPDGSYAFALSAGDIEGNTRTQSGYSVDIDGTGMTATDVQIDNGATTTGRAELGDTITYTFSEALDPQSILAGWTGASQDVVVRIDNVTSGNSDSVAIYDAANTTLLPFGTVGTGGNFVGASRTFGASGTASTMVMSGTTITITLGTASGTVRTVTANATASWSPSSSATDVAGNAMSTTAATESGGGDHNF